MSDALDHPDSPRPDGSSRRLHPLLEWLVARRSLIPSAVLVLGLAASLAVAVLLSRLAEARDEERFIHDVERTQAAIRDRLDTYVAVLLAGAGMFGATDLAVGAEEFRRFADRLDLQRRYPGIQGIGYSARVTADRRPELLVTMAKQGLPAFRVWPEQPRDEYHAILYLEPLERRNRAAIGYDMFTEPVRRAAMEWARDTGQPAASGKVELVQEIDEQKQAGFLIYVPVYRGAIPSDAAERRARIAGFVYSPFRADDLLRGILGGGERGLAFDVYDGEAAPADRLHSSVGAAAPEDEAPRLEAVRRLDVAGRPWTIAYRTRPDFERASGRIFVWLTFAGGLLATGLLTAAAWVQSRSLSAQATAAAENARLYEAAERELGERRRVEGRQKLLLDELNHRVKNTLAAVQSIAAQTLRHAPSPQTFAGAFESRLMALSKAHNLLTETQWEGVVLAALVRQELSPYAIDGAARFSIAGPEVRLRPNAAVALGMALHELASNAASHGALSVPAGRVAVSWRVEAGRLLIDWRETGGPPVAEPARRGFGSRLLERGLARQLDGTVALEFALEGVRCTIDVPLAPTAAAA